MGIVLDIVIVALLALSIFLGYKKGLVGVAFKILSFIIAIVLAFALSKPIGNLIIENTDFDDNIHNTIKTTLESKPTENISKEEKTDTSKVITDYLAGEIKKATSEKQNEIALTVATNLTNTIIQAICFIGIYILARIVLFFFKFLAESLAELPIVKQFNEAGGVLYGILRGIFIVYLFFGIVSLLASIIDLGDFLAVINSSYIGSFAYNNNLLLKILF